MRDLFPLEVHVKSRFIVMIAGLSFGLFAACGNVEMESEPLAQDEVALVECPCGGVGPWNCNPCAFICGDGFCDTANGESNSTCAEDCPPQPFCGDGVCNPGEQGWCSDCNPPTTWCGDGICNGNETLSSCLEDCKYLTCGNGLCEFHEFGWCADCGPICMGPGCPQVPQEP